MPHKLEFSSILYYYSLWWDSSQNTMFFRPEESPSVCWYALGNAKHPVGTGDWEYIWFLCMGEILMRASIIFSFSLREKLDRKGVSHGLGCSTPSHSSSLIATVPTFLHLLLGALQDSWPIMYDSPGGRGTRSLKDAIIKWKARGLYSQTEGVWVLPLPFDFFVFWHLQTG